MAGAEAWGRVSVGGGWGCGGVFYVRVSNVVDTPNKRNNLTRHRAEKQVLKKMRFKAGVEVITISAGETRVTETRAQIGIGNALSLEFDGNGQTEERKNMRSGRGEGRWGSRGV